MFRAGAPLLAIGALLLCGCGSGPAASAGGSEEQALTTFWEIGGMLDEFVLSARFEPSRPKPDQPASLIVTGSSDDMDRPFKGEVWHRVAKSEDSQDPWLPMTMAEEKDGEATFRSTVTLPKGVSYVQFRVKRVYDEQEAELLDWSVPIE